MSITINKPYEGLDYKEIAKGKSLFIALPMYCGNLSFGFFTSMLRLRELMIDAGLKHRLEFLTTESLITRGRCTLSSIFLNETNYSHFLFIDSDLTFNPEAVFRFLQFDEPIVGGIYPKKQFDWVRMIKKARENASAEEIWNNSGTFVLNHISIDDLTPEEREIYAKGGEITRSEMPQKDGFVEVAEVGTGFLMVKREAFEKMAIDYPQIYFPEEHFQKPEAERQKRYLFFDTELQETPFGTRLLSEDYAFCVKARKSGFKIWADLLSGFGHTGFNTWAGTYANTIEFVKK